MKLALHAADKALRRFEVDPTAATTFFDQDLSIFIDEVEGAIGTTKETRHIRTYLMCYESGNIRQRREIAIEFFSDKLPGIIKKLEGHYGKA